MTNALMEFLTRCLDEDEQVARSAIRAKAPDDEWALGQWEVLTDGSRYVEGQDITIYDEGGHSAEQARHIARHDPRSVLADIAAKRAVLELYRPVAEYDNAEESYEHATGRAVGLGEAVRALALAYAHRDGYREEWRPR